MAKIVVALIAMVQVTAGQISELVCVRVADQACSN